MASRLETTLTRRALITGITGQDGTYLAEHLLQSGYEVFGLVRGQTAPSVRSLRQPDPAVKLISGDLLDQTSLVAAIERAVPDEVYNLGALSYVPVSWRQSTTTAEVTGMGVLRMLEALRIVGGLSDCRGPAAGQPRFYQASSSEMFGKVREPVQNELTPFHPRSPYGAAKAFGHYMVQNYRESYGMYAVSGILFNHESPVRGPEFVTRKVSLGVAAVKLGIRSSLRLGNLSAERDWGFAGDYVRGMVLMLAQDEPEDYVLGTGVTYSVRQLVEAAFAHVGLNWRDHVVVDESLIRPAEVELLCADPTKARQRLGWKPSVSFEEMVAMMVDSDLRLLADTDGSSHAFSAELAELW
ncbi:GDP-mannose 4,6-dehydratase [Micromonospora sp. KC207]|uniref:GDP-mannose 4,6-dehydratase n=1 Tax=Micromonospora sp. KC207 TaxID=2530377 RepID=UPI001FB7D141|nr:GDP-mannose 4,6-dehydratase [Micromonospora sp. KC207]